MILCVLLCLWYRLNPPTAPSPVLCWSTQKSITERKPSHLAHLSNSWQSLSEKRFGPLFLAESTAKFAAGASHFSHMPLFCLPLLVCPACLPQIGREDSLRISHTAPRPAAGGVQVEWWDHSKTRITSRSHFYIWKFSASKHPPSLRMEMKRRI